MAAALVVCFLSTVLLSMAQNSDLCPNMLSGGATWYCIACGGTFASCSFNGDASDACETTAVPPGCNPLPNGATDYLCCEDCNVQTSDEGYCTYQAPSPPPPPPPGSGNGGSTSSGGCFALSQTVNVFPNHVCESSQARLIPVSNVSAGDYVSSTTNGCSQVYYAYTHEKLADTIIFRLANNASIEVTKNHILPTTHGYLRASAVQLSDSLVVSDGHVSSTASVISITGHQSLVRALLTRNDMIIVNGVVCSVHSYDHELFSWLSLPLRWMYDYVPGAMQPTKSVMRIFDAVVTGVEASIWA